MDDVHIVAQFVKLNRYDEKFVVRTGVSCQKHPHRIRGCTITPNPHFTLDCTWKIVVNA